MKMRNIVSTTSVTSNKDELLVLMKAISVVLFLCVLYAFLICDYIDLDETHGSIFSIVLIPTVALISLHFMLKSPFSLKEYGFNLNKFRESIPFLLKLTSLIIVIAIIAKLLFLNFDSDYANVSLISPKLAFSRFEEGIGWGISVLYVSLYVILVPLQEIAIRGLLQSLIHRNLKLINSSHRALFSIVLPNLVFAFTHLHLSVQFAATAFFLGLAWGWLYNKTHSLVGVIICHTVVGLISVFVIGFIG